MLYESNHRHAHRVIEELELKKGQSVVTPSVRDSWKTKKREQEGAGAVRETAGARPHVSNAQRGANMGRAPGEKSGQGVPDPTLVPRKAERMREGHRAIRTARSTGRTAGATSWATRRTRRPRRPLQAEGGCE